MKKEISELRARMLDNPSANLDWCAPYMSKDGRFSVISTEGEIEGLLADGKEFATPHLLMAPRFTEETLRKFAERCNPAYDADCDTSEVESYIYDALSEKGCWYCPAFWECDALDGEAVGVYDTETGEVEYYNE